MGSCCWLNGYLVMTAKMDVRYKAKIPIQDEYIATSKIKSVRGRRLIVEAEITDCGGKLYACSEGIFISVSPEKLASPPEYAERFDQAARFFRLRQQGLSVKEIFKCIGHEPRHYMGRKKSTT